MNIKEQIVETAIRWARAKEAEASKDERKMESTVTNRTDQAAALEEIRRLALLVPHSE